MSTESQNVNTPPPDPEKLWDRRWLSHRASLWMLLLYVVAIIAWPEVVPVGGLWPLVGLSSFHYGPAMLEALAKLRRP